MLSCIRTIINKCSTPSNEDFDMLVYFNERIKLNKKHEDKKWHRYFSR